MPRSLQLITPARALACCLALAFSSPAVAHAGTARFEIKAEPLSAGLKDFAQQAHMQLLYEYGLVRNLRGNAVQGVMEKHAALEVLLHNTGLKAIFSSADAATIRRASAPPANDDSKSPVPDVNGDEQKSDSPPANRLAMITVTATRVATPEQLAPVAISVYTGGQLQSAGVYDLTSLQSIDPSINITQGTGEPYIAIRGVTSSNTTEVGNPAVSLAQNGFFTNRA